MKLLPISWDGFAVRPLPLFMLLLGAASLAELVKRRKEPRARSKLILRLTIVVFSFVLLWKIILNARLEQYGFVLAMPGTLLLVVAITGWVPEWLSGLGGYGAVFRYVGLAVIVVVVSASLQITDSWFSSKVYPVSSGADKFLADQRALFVTKTLEEIAARVGPDQSLAVFPEGVMLNYLSRRVNPTLHINFMPPELIIFGEKQILNSLKAHPPDYIVLVHKDTSEYGFRFFGRDYGQRIFSWIQMSYRPVKLIGSPPLRNQSFGILLMERSETS